MLGDRDIAQECNLLLEEIRPQRSRFLLGRARPAAPTETFYDIEEAVFGCLPCRQRTPLNLDYLVDSPLTPELSTVS
ncbi:hypothetical protein NONO_c36580 [Nocardia nova SH22a]|uniref:Uncharacterized protein n=1 Tax=Nocardia nova SH22a TaxID=1415166 RepID=W5TGI2_9NOCA|nr:hypothetical protein NONO_c36580 [Nocardia nova SH22a]